MLDSNGPETAQEITKARKDLWQLILRAEVEAMEQSVATEIDKIVQEIERLKSSGDPEGRIADLNEYLRVLYLKLKTELQQGPKPWE
jgi:hypothetical protein